jgi:hypothetical protein
MSFLEKDLKVESVLTYDDKRTKYSNRIVLRILQMFTTTHNDRYVICQIYAIKEQKIYESWLCDSQWSIL